MARSLATASGGPVSDSGGLTRCHRQAELAELWSCPKRWSRVPSASLPVGACRAVPFNSKTAVVGLAELRRDRPAGRRIVVDGVGDREVTPARTSPAASDARPASASLLRQRAAASSTLNSLSTKLPLGARPGPLRRQARVGQHFQADAGDALQLRLGRDRVEFRSQFLPLARIEPSVCLRQRRPALGLRPSTTSSGVQRPAVVLESPPPRPALGVEWPSRTRSSAA